LSNSTMKMSLIENALDFLEEAADRLELSEDSPLQNYKYAILHLSSAIELLLKQRLFDEHWSLIFSTIEKANKSELESGKFKSVYLDEAMQRLISICEISFEKHKEVLQQLKNSRNNIEHYHVVIDRLQAASLLVKNWSFVVDFVSTHLRLDTPELIDRFAVVKEKIHRIEVYVQNRVQDIKAKLEGYKNTDIAVIDCPICLQITVPITGEDTQCLFCAEKYPAKALKSIWFSQFSEFSNMSYKDKYTTTLLHNCPHCYEESFYHLLDSDRGYEWICLSCGYHLESNLMSQCSSCGSLYVDKNPMESIGMCHDCIETRLGNF
jgi:hypothetical protein